MKQIARLWGGDNGFEWERIEKLHLQYSKMRLKLFAERRISKCRYTVHGDGTQISNACISPFTHSLVPCATICVASIQSGIDMEKYPLSIVSIVK